MSRGEVVDLLRSRKLGLVALLERAPDGAIDMELMHPEDFAGWLALSRAGAKRRRDV